MNERNRILYQFVDNNNIPFYVGITNNYKRRLNEHLLVLKKGKNGKTWPVYNKIRKLIREENYQLKMEIVKNNLTFEEAKHLEIKTIAEYRKNNIKLYNLTAGGDGITGYKPVFTKEWRKKLSEAKKGDKWSGVNNPNFGKKFTPERKEKMSLDRKGKFVGAENPFYGKKHTEKTKQIIAERAKKTFLGIPKSQEHKKKISQAHVGKKHSPEHKEKNRLKSCNIYKIVIIESKQEFIWNRGCKELSKYLINNYNIKITSSSLTMAAKENRPTRKIIITRLPQNI